LSHSVKQLKLAEINKNELMATARVSRQTRYQGRQSTLSNQASTSSSTSSLELSAVDVQCLSKFGIFTNWIPETSYSIIRYCRFYPSTVTMAEAVISSTRMRYRRYPSSPRAIIQLARSSNSLRRCRSRSWIRMKNCALIGEDKCSKLYLKMLAFVV